MTTTLVGSAIEAPAIADHRAEVLLDRRHSTCNAIVPDEVERNRRPNGNSLMVAASPMADKSRRGRIPGRNVTRDELAIAVGKATPRLSRTEARALVDQFFSEIEGGLRTDRIVSLQGFRVFKLRSKVARLGRNPRSNAGVIYPIPAQEAVSFKASPILRRSIEPGQATELVAATESP